MKPIMKLYLIMMAITGTVFLTNSAFSMDNKLRLVKSIEAEQKQSEDKIINLWMSGERGEKLELAMAEYLTLEVRQRALASENSRKTLLESVSANKSFSHEKTIDLARSIVIEYFKRRGIDFEEHRFVKGVYHLRIQ